MSAETISNLMALAKQCTETARYLDRHVELMRKGHDTSHDRTALRAILLRQENAMIEVRLKVRLSGE